MRKVALENLTLKGKIYNLFNRMQKLCELIKLLHSILKSLKSIGDWDSMKGIIIGIFVINACQANLMYAVILHCFSEQLWITRCRIVMSGDVEVNPGPKCNSCQSQSFAKVFL